jgi:hypothetical protein
MTTTKQPRLSNILLAMIAVLIIIMLVLQVYMLTELHRPVLRPALKAPTRAAPQLPDAWYEKFKNPETMKLEALAPDI